MEVLDVTQADMTEMMTTGEEAGIETGQGAAVLEGLAAEAVLQGEREKEGHTADPGAEVPTGGMLMDKGAAHELAALMMIDTLTEMMQNKCFLFYGEGQCQGIIVFIC